MNKYFFHLHECGAVSADTLGQELIDSATALQVAIRKAWQVMADEVAKGHLCLRCHIVIENAATGERTDVPFRDALRITGL